MLFSVGHPGYPGVKFAPFQGSDKKFLHLTTGVCGSHCLLCKQHMKDMNDFSVGIPEDLIRNYNEQVNEAREYLSLLKTALEAGTMRAEKAYKKKRKFFSTKENRRLVENAKKTSAVKQHLEKFSQINVPLIPNAGSETCGTDDLHNNTANYRLFSDTVKSKARCGQSEDFVEVLESLLIFTGGCEGMINGKYARKFIEKIDEVCDLLLVPSTDKIKLKTLAEKYIELLIQLKRFESPTQ